MNRIPTLDGWRGLAILLVLISHTAIALRRAVHLQHAASIGQQGVTIFFVLSGFLITSRLLAEEEKCGCVCLRSFYIRRFFRLMPCAWTYLALVSVGVVESGHAFSVVHLLPCLFFFRNYVGTSGVHTITGHFWSLSIEEQFYLMWPSVLLLSGRKRAVWLAVGGAVCIATYRFLQWGNLSRLPLEATLGTQYRADALLIGCAAALLLPAAKPFLRAWMILPLLALLVSCGIEYRHLIPLHESAAVALILAATSENPHTYISRALDWKPLAYLGRASYSLYVWQQLFLSGVHTEPGILVSLLALSVGAFVSYHLIEQPFVRYGKRLSLQSAAV